MENKYYELTAMLTIPTNVGQIDALEKIQEAVEALNGSIAGSITEVDENGKPLEDNTAEQGDNC